MTQPGPASRRTSLADDVKGGLATFVIEAAIVVATAVAAWLIAVVVLALV